ncbi:hypothetical protein AgCh_021470 [Apium graveolens]
MSILKVTPEMAMGYAKEKGKNIATTFKEFSGNLLSLFRPPSPSKVSSFLQSPSTEDKNSERAAKIASASEEFTQSMRVRDDSVFPGYFRTGWDTTLGTVNKACPDINPADYVCPDDEALLQRFRTRVVISDCTPQDPLLPPPESSSRPSADDSSSSSGTTETSSESDGDDDIDTEGTSAP